MATLKSLAARLTTIATKQNKSANKSVTDATLAILKDLTYISTPVDTSKALSNWTVTIGSINASYHPAFVEGELGNTRSSSAAIAMAKATNVLKTRQPGQPVYLSNAAPYIVKLNEGSSKQAPAGFVERSLFIGSRMGVTIREVS